MRFFIFFLLLLPSGVAEGQAYAESIMQFRKHYIEELLADKRRPVNSAQVKYLDFFPPDQNYCVWADFSPTPGNTPFLIHTHSGKDKPFREYGILKFTLNSDTLSLHVYQMIDLVNDAAHKDDLFIPFNDLSNYENTYGGGRYIDLSVNDIKDNKILLDFNKCYNPYCAYADGFSCPVPPRENGLRVEINAGEKVFLH